MPGQERSLTMCWQMDVGLASIERTAHLLAPVYQEMGTDLHLATETSVSSACDSLGPTQRIMQIHSGCTHDLSLTNQSATFLWLLPLVQGCACDPSLANESQTWDFRALAGRSCFSFMEFEAGGI